MVVIIGVGLVPVLAFWGDPEGPQPGDTAPHFSLISSAGGEVGLSGLLEEHETVVLVFYRGFF